MLGQGRWVYTSTYYIYVLRSLYIKIDSSSRTVYSKITLHIKDRIDAAELFVLSIGVGQNQK